MTTLVSIRVPVEIRERLRRKARPNVNAWLNALLRRELGSHPAATGDWRAVLRRPLPKVSDRDYEQCLIPE